MMEMQVMPFLALPELAKRDVKASFFVCAGQIGTKHYLDKSMIIDLIESRDADRKPRNASPRLVHAWSE